MTGCMRPVNVGYFTVRRQDFGMPEIADLLMEKYGEDRGEGKKLYRFPITFASDDLSQVLDFKFQYFTGSGLKFWSDEDGDRRVCKTYAPVKINPTTKKAERMPGGRGIEIRGECKPDDCPDFQCGNCKMRGRLLFYVPGIPGTGMFEVPTGSKNFGFGSEQTLQEVRNLTGGKLRGLNGGKPVFWLTKKFERDLPMIGDDGKPTRTDQWLIEITADIDMSRMSENQLLLASPASAQASADALTGTLLPANVVPIHEVSVAPSAVVNTEAVDTTTQQASDVPSHQVESTPLAEVVVEQPPAASTVASQENTALVASVGQTPEQKREVTQKRKDIGAKLELFGITPEQFKTYADSAFGDGWSRDMIQLTRADKELTEVMGFSVEERDDFKSVVLSYSTVLADAA